MIAIANAGNWEYNDGRIIINVYPPIQAYPGDTIRIRVRVEALEDLKDVDIDIDVFGSKKEGYDTWYRYLLVLSDRDLSGGVVRDENFTMIIPSDASPGLTYAIINIHYKYYSWFVWHDYYADATFQMTYIYPGLLSERDYWKGQANYWKEQADYWENQYKSMKSDRDYWKNKYESKESEFNELKSDYDSLNSTYNEYKQRHSYTNDEYYNLKSKYDALASDFGTTRNVSYILVVTTIVFIATTAYLAIRKPKVKPT
jgi:hypothetical protein